MTSGAARRGGALALILPMARPHIGTVALGVVATLAQTAAALAIPYLVKIGIDDGVLAPDPAVLTWAAAGCVVLAVLEVLAARAQIRAVAVAGHNILLAVRVALFGHLQRLSMQFHEHTRTGRVVASLTGDIEAMSALLTQGLATFVASSLTLVGTAVILVVLDPRLALATLVVVPILAASTVWFRRRSVAAWRQVRESSTAVTIQLQQTLAAMHILQAFRHEKATLAELTTANAAEQQAKRATVRIAASYFPSVDLCAALASVAVLGAGSHQIVNGDLEIGTLAAFLLYLRGFFSPVYELSGVFDSVQAASAGAERINEIMAAPQTVPEAAAPVRLRRVRGTVALTDVRFAYHDADGVAGPDVLHEVNLTAAAGATLAVMGPSGAGKSTLAKLMLRFYDPRSGQVTLDGIDLRQLSLTDLRRAVAYVPQEGYLFSDTIIGNIRYGRPTATREEVETAARTLGIWSLLQATPDGLDTRIGDRGSHLAASQRQVIAILRAWIADPAVLIWDEATSDLDTDIDRAVQQAAKLLRRGRTTIVITHRLAHAMEADTVAVICDGAVVQCGTPADLINSPGWLASTREQRAPSDVLAPPATHDQAHGHGHGAGRGQVTAGTATPGPAERRHNPVDKAVSSC